MVFFPHESNHESNRQSRHWGNQTEGGGNGFTDRIPEVGVGETHVKGGVKETINTVLKNIFDAHILTPTTDTVLFKHHIVRNLSVAK